MFHKGCVFGRWRDEMMSYVRDPAWPPQRVYVPVIYGSSVKKDEFVARLLIW